MMAATAVAVVVVVTTVFPSNDEIVEVRRHRAEADVSLLPPTLSVHASELAVNDDPAVLLAVLFVASSCCCCCC